MRAAPRTDPSVRNYRTGLLPQVQREVAHQEGMHRPGFRALSRTRSSALSAPDPALRPGRVLLAMFPLTGGLSSTDSASARAALFTGFAGTTPPSDFPRSYISGLPPQRSLSGPPGDRPDGRAVGSPGSRARGLRTCTGSSTARGPPTARASAADDVAFRLGDGVSTPDKSDFAAQWLACTYPC